MHDHLVQRGGAERVALMLAREFSERALYSPLYDAGRTYPEFREVAIRSSSMNRFGIVRRHHRAALPLLAPILSRTTIDADVTVCSSSGWAHGVRVTGRKIVYWHSPARWLYSDEFLRAASRTTRLSSALLHPLLHRWDQRAAAGADVFLANSTAIRDAIRAAYGRDAEVLHPPPTLDADGTTEPYAPGGTQVRAGYHLCVSRLLPYKNVGAVVQAFAGLPEERLVVVGTGPLDLPLRRDASPNVHFAGSVSDETLRWLYAHSCALITASYEDFGLTPLEAASFGKPCIALRWGGHLDSVVEGVTGTFFDRPQRQHVEDAVRQVAVAPWHPDVIRAHAGRFSEARFLERLRSLTETLAVGAS